MTTPPQEETQQAPMLSTDQLRQLSADVARIARAAGDIILGIYGSKYAVETKTDDTPVTTADLAADDHIHTALEQLSHSFPVLSEESADIPRKERKQWQTYWLVDPLDGTREFIKRNGEFSVNIALIHDGKPILGVVYAPVLDDLYFAYADGGAWKQSSALEPAKRISVRKMPESGPTVARSRARHTSSRLQSYLNKLGEHDEVSIGSALKSCLVAEGTADVYPCLGPTSEWDSAAAHCLVTEAGGRVTDAHMQPLEYNTKDSLLNPHFFVSGDNSEDWSQYLEPEPKQAHIK